MSSKARDIYVYRVDAETGILTDIEAHDVDTEDTLKQLQGFVEGYVQIAGTINMVQLDSNGDQSGTIPYTILVDEEGKLKGKRPNFVFHAPTGAIADILVGHVVLIKSELFN